MKKLTFFKTSLVFILICLLSSVFCLLSSVFCLLTYAAVPHLINYQGRLTDKDGKPLEGAYAMTLRLYDAETAGNLLWEETHSGLVIQKGVFSLLLGSVTNLDLTFDKPYFLEIKLGSEVMSPRQRIASVGYAIRAEKAEAAEEAERAKSADGIIKASGGLIIETRTSDPTAPSTGQIWLRTDL